MEELNAITIGRDETCNIVVPEDFDTVSNFHAVITLENNIYTFADESSNGSSVNGERINLSMTQVNVGDVILLADSYQVDWSEVTRLLRSSHPTVRNRSDHNPTPQPIQEPAPQPIQEPDPFVYPTPSPVNPMNPIIDEVPGNPYTPLSDDANDNYTKKWNWGAFLATLPWGIFHKVWRVLWLIPILAIANFLIFTIDDTTIKTILIITQVFIVLLYGVYFGHYGSEMALEKQNDKNILKFKKKQRIWMWVGILIVVLNLGYLAWAYGPSIWSSPKVEQTTSSETNGVEDDDQDNENNGENADNKKEDDSKKGKSTENDTKESSKADSKEEDVKQAEYVDDYDE